MTALSSSRNENLKASINELLPLIKQLTFLETKRTESLINNIPDETLDANIETTLKEIQSICLSALNVIPQEFQQAKNKWHYKLAQEMSPTVFREKLTNSR